LRKSKNSSIILKVIILKLQKEFQTNFSIFITNENKLEIDWIQQPTEMMKKLLLNSNKNLKNFHTTQKNFQIVKTKSLKPRREKFQTLSMEKQLNQKVKLGTTLLTQ
jgi:hypothetical protein